MIRISLSFARTFAAVALLGAAVLPASSEVVFSDLSFGDTTGAAVSGPGGFYGAGQTGYAAGEFTTTSAITLTDALVHVYTYANSGSPLFSAYLAPDNSGVPGADLYDFATGSAPVGDNSTPVTLSGSYDLLANTTYWLVLTPDNSSSSVTWEFGGTPTSSSYAQSSDGSNWTAGSGQAIQFEIDGQASAPEPASFLLVAPALLGAYFVRRRRSA